MRSLLIALALLVPMSADASSKVVAVSVDGVVYPITVEIVSRALDLAKRDNADLVLMRLNTPGGLMESARQTVEKVIASPVPVAMYVTPSGGHAASAGFFLLEAGDIAAMAPGTNTGAASPVLLGQQMDQVMRNKVENDASAWLRGIVSKRARNSALAEKTISEAKAFSSQEALDEHLIDLVAISERQLIDQLNGREITRFDGRKQTLNLTGAEIVSYPLTWRESIVSKVSDPNIGFILLVLGALGIYVEFSSPGLIFPGVAGAILALLGLSALAVLPINWLGVALLVLALSLFILEAKFASHGILGTGGTVAMILGALLLVEGPPELRIRFSTAFSVTIPFAIITMFLVSLVLKARANKVVTGGEGMLDQIGVVRSALAPQGKIFVHGEYWDAVSPTPVAEGSRVRVVAIDGLLLRVEPL